MKESDLKQLGLSQTEATLYLCLLRIGASDVQTIIQETGFYKANTYDALERLCEKGLISRVSDGKRRIYQLQKPEALTEFIMKKKNELADQELLAEELSKQVTLAKKHIHTPETAVVLRGLSGVKQIYSEIVEQQIDYLSFGGPPESDTVIGSYYWQNLHEKQKEFGIKAKMIFHNSLREWTGKVPAKLIELRFFDKEFEPLTETTIYGNKVAFVIWLEKPVITIIDNEHMANSFRQLFDILWKQSTP